MSFFSVSVTIEESKGIERTGKKWSGFAGNFGGGYYFLDCPLTTQEVAMLVLGERIDGAEYYGTGIVKNGLCYFLTVDSVSFSKQEAWGDRSFTMKSDGSKAENFQSIGD